MKTEQELRDKLSELLAIDCTVLGPAIFIGPDAVRQMTFSKVAACKTLLWALGENDDDHWHITAKAGPPLRAESKVPA